MTKIVNCYQTRANSQKRSFNLKFFNVSIFCLILVSGFLYLINISDLTVKGFALRELKIQASSLASEKLTNEEKVNSLQSYYSLNSRAEKLNMVAIGDIEYLAVSGSTVAKK